MGCFFTTKSDKSELSILLTCYSEAHYFEKMTIQPFKKTMIYSMVAN